MAVRLLIFIFLLLFSGSLFAKDEQVSFVPSVDYKAFLLRQTVNTAERRERVINILLELLRMYPENVDKAQLKVRLAQLYLDKSRYLYFLELYKNDPEAEKILRGESAMQKQNLSRLNLRDSYSYNRQAIAIYREVLGKYPSIPNRDEVLFYYAYNLGEVGDIKQAQALYNQVVRDYPKSRYVAEAFLVQAEYLFYSDKFSQALPIYQKVLGYKDTQVRDLASYKIAWCYFNLGRLSSALKTMEKLAEVREQLGGDFDLREEAVRDLVIMFSYGGYHKEAPFFFKQIGGVERYRPMIKQLASLYFAQGKNSYASELYRRIITEDPSDKENPEMQKRLVEIAKRLGKKEDVIVEAGKLVRFYSDESNWSAKNKNDWSALQQAKELSESTLREIALSMHNEAQKTKDERTYSLAMASYREYLDNFPDGKDTQKVRFYYAESLYKLSKFELAGIEYTKVVTADPTGPYALQAGWGAIVSYDDVLKSQGGVKSSAVDKKPTLIPIWERETVRVADNFSQYFPQDRRAPQVAFKAAKVFYDHNHFKEAVRRFDQLIQENPGAATTKIAADLVLDSWNIQEKWDEVVKWGKKYYAHPGYPVAAKPKLTEIIEKASFKISHGLEEAGKYKEAAESYLKFAEDFKNSDFVDDAFNNAAVSYRKGKDAAQAIAIYKRLIQSRPNSPFVQNAILAVAKSYEDLAMFAEAANHYESYQQRYPSANNAGDLIYNAGVFRENLGQTDKALQNYRTYVSRYRNEKDLTTTEFAIAQLLEKDKRYAQAAAEYSKLAGKYRGQANFHLIAQGKSAEMTLKSGDAGRANSLFRQTLSSYQNYTAGGKKVALSPEAVELVGESQFKMIEPAFNDYTRVKLNVPLASFPSVLSRKIKMLEQLVRDYQKVVNLKAGLWTVSAIHRIASAYDDFGSALSAMDDPAGLAANEKQAFTQLIKENSQNMKNKAVEAYSACIEKAADLDVFDPLVEKAEKRLADLSAKPKTEVKEFVHEPIYIDDTIGNGALL